MPSTRPYCEKHSAWVWLLTAWGAEAGGSLKPELQTRVTMQPEAKQTFDQNLFLYLWTFASFQKPA